MEGPRKRKQTKQDALRDAERKKARLERMKGTVEGVEAERGHAMERALKRAQGEKVLDDPKLLKKALRKDRREKKRKREAWKGRSKEEADGVKARQARAREDSGDSSLVVPLCIVASFSATPHIDKAA